MWVSRARWVHSSAPELISNHLKTSQKTLKQTKVNPHDRIDGKELTSVFHKNIMGKELNKKREWERMLGVFDAMSARAICFVYKFFNFPLKIFFVSTSESEEKKELHYAHESRHVLKLFEWEMALWSWRKWRKIYV